MNLQHAAVHFAVVLFIYLFSSSSRTESRLMFLYLFALISVGSTELPEMILSYVKTKIFPELAAGAIAIAAGIT